VGRAAGRSLVQLANEPLRGNEVVASLVLGEMRRAGESRRPFVTRMACLEALPHFVAQGHAEALELVTGSLGDRSEFVRIAALDALASIAPRGDPAALQAVLEGSRDGLHTIRRAAACAGVRLATAGDESIVAMLLGMLADPEAWVRLTAIESLAGFAPAADAAVCAAVCACLEDKDQAVRDVVPGALAKLKASGADVDQLKALTGERLEHAKAHCRQAAVHSLAQVADQNDAQVIAWLHRALSDVSPPVRQAALDSIVKVADRDDPSCRALLQEAMSGTADRRPSTIAAEDQLAAWLAGS